MDTSATKVTMPFVEDSLSRARALMGPNMWSYGLQPNRHVLDAFLRYHYDQACRRAWSRPTNFSIRRRPKPTAFR